METQAEVSQAMESLHAKAARLALQLEEAGDLPLPEVMSLLDDIDALRALHLRVVMRGHASVQPGFTRRGGTISGSQPL